ncbi:hypothetical protein BAGA_22030 [Bacillus gaemokensis]|uniref:Amino acid permease n=1 Tax=Bacillus gaemokensis TaxID=574375 RepID=A0A073K6D4_9BACI|nr:hypothetical protein BAGA_22030 [Bacillus gaemokensis]
MNNNSFITIFKIIIPGLTIGTLLFVGFHGGNFSSNQGFVPSGWSNVLTAMATSGIIFAFNGFQSPINMTGEAKNPGRSIPRAVIGSLLIATVIYVLLQITFIGAVDPTMIVNVWSNLNFNSPYRDVNASINLLKLAM